MKKQSKSRQAVAERETSPQRHSPALGGTRVVGAAAYIRFSDVDESHSAHNQRETIRAFAKQRGFQIVTEIHDCKKTGSSIEGRPAFEKLQHDVKRRVIVICYDESRWRRDIG